MSDVRKMKRMRLNMRIVSAVIWRPGEDVDGKGKVLRRMVIAPVPANEVLYAAE